MKLNLCYFQKIVWVLVFMSLSLADARAQEWDEIMKSVASDRINYVTVRRQAFDRYAYSVSVSGNYAVVGSLGSGPVLDGFYTPEGLAYILQNVGGSWKQVKIIRSPTVDQDPSYFGTTVAISGDYVIVGAPQRDEDSVNVSTTTLTNTGAAFIYKKDQGGPNRWGLVKKLNASYKNGDEEFGVSVHINGDYAIVGAHRESEDAANASPLSHAGAAYIFKKNQGGTDNWGEVRKITPPDRAAGDNFGKAVAITGNYAIVGAPFSDAAGAAYIFRGDNGGADNWGYSARLVSEGHIDGESFGASVAISGDHAVVGAPTRTALNGPGDDAANAGAAGVFIKDDLNPDAWTLVREITSEDEGHQLGLAVAIDGAYALIGAPGTPPVSGGNLGTVYVLWQNQEGSGAWGIITEITATRTGSASDNDLYGSAVGISGSTVIVGAKEDGTYKEGAAYVHEQTQGGANNFGQLASLMPMHSDFQDYFGHAVAVSGNYAVVSAVSDTEDENGQNRIVGAGSVYIFFNNSQNWQQIKKMVATDRVLGTGYGVSVAISDSYIAVGAAGGKAVYLYGKDTGGAGNWGLIKKIESPSEVDDGFGTSVSVSGNYLLVGAPRYSYDENGSPIFLGGFAHFYQKDQGGTGNWGLVRSIQAPVHNTFDNFGYAVSMDGEYAVIGALSESGDGAGANPLNGAGAAYVVQMNTGGANNWGLVKKIVADERVEYANFGSSVYIQGDHIVVGAPGDFANVQNGGTPATFNGVGAAHVFSKDQGGTNNWGFVKKLTDPSPNEDQGFGSSVTINGDHILIGSPKADDGISPGPGFAPTDGGVVFIFRKNDGGNDNWGLFQELMGSDYTHVDRFGAAVAASGRNLVVGAPLVDTDEQSADYLYDAGAIYFFDNEDSSLPVVLASFEARESENSALLTWETTAETNSGFYQVQHSRDAINWEDIGNVAASGESNTALTYSFNHDAPFEGINFYRLKMVDLDGTFAYSVIRNLLFGEFLAAKIYPNPAFDRVYLKNGKIGDIESVSVVNMQGKEVIRLASPGREGFSVQQLVAGKYVIQFRLKDGRSHFQTVVVSR
ncbi:T9SS type A sorting domain-containing protein [Dyadobacter bucti]|uniref:T9SS type A sorting domain-containing protein n=1 Tax=Dyadobacter bucti TaxID=2572203 RepID=UPI003F6F5D94